MKTTKFADGEIYGQLLVVRFSHLKGKAPVYECLCDCGNTCNKRIWEMRNGKVSSCGCAKRKLKTHGQTRGEYSRIYRIWRGMKSRCYNENNKNYFRYGGRGVIVFDSWVNNYSEFQRWSLENGYKDNLTIDRVDNNGNYEPSNCRWTTMVVQARNRRNSMVVIYNGESVNLMEISEKVGIRVSVIRSRLNYEWSIEKSIETPLRRIHNK